MEQASAQTIATFTGTLLRRERAIEQRFVQLVFREDGKDWLCVSSDPRTASLPVGQRYRIEGEYKERGERSFIYNPKIALFKSHSFPARRIAFISIVAICVLAFGGVAYMHEHNINSKSASQPSSPVTTPTATTTSNQTTMATQPSASAQPATSAATNSNNTVGTPITTTNAVAKPAAIKHTIKQAAPKTANPTPAPLTSTPSQSSSAQTSNTPTGSTPAETNTPTPAATDTTPADTPTQDQGTPASTTSTDPATNQTPAS